MSWQQVEFIIDPKLQSLIPLITMKILIYDSEIINCIPSKYEKQKAKVSYCQGWNDYKGMGISVIGTWRNYDLIKIGDKFYEVPLIVGKYFPFVNKDNCSSICNLENFKYFQALANKADKIIGFNSLSFDDKLCQGLSRTNVVSINISKNTLLINFMAICL